MEVAIHRVSTVSVIRNEFNATASCDAFHTTELVVTDDEGHTVCVKLFSPERLKIVENTEEGAE